MSKREVIEGDTDREKHRRDRERCSLSRNVSPIGSSFSVSIFVSTSLSPALSLLYRKLRLYALYGLIDILSDLIRRLETIQIEIP
jgi:hypothetical protein